MVGRAKWDAWNGLKGTDKDAAKQQYVDLISWPELTAESRGLRMARSRFHRVVQSRPFILFGRGLFLLLCQQFVEVLDDLAFDAVPERAQQKPRLGVEFEVVGRDLERAASRPSG